MYKLQSYRPSCLSIYIFFCTLGGREFHAWQNTEMIREIQMKYAFMSSLMRLSTTDSYDAQCESQQEVLLLSTLICKQIF
jgi:hypothetical protein